MSSTLPSPPPSPSPTTDKPSIDLTTQLDTLLESYLTLLDTHTTLRTQLSTTFCSGFLSLAHANRNAASVLGAGRRFGRDGYDERMKASRGISIQRTAEKLKGEEAQLKDEDLAAQQISKNSSNTPKDSKNPEPTSKPLPTDTPLSNTDLEHLTFTSIPLTPSPSGQTKNPLNWFTALPPPPLRQTQHHFTSAATTTIPQLLSTISAMSALETKIWDVREEMGILDQYQSKYEDEHEVAGNVDVDEHGQREDEAQLKEKQPKEVSSLPSPSKKQKFVNRTRTAEPRSRVMKID